LPFGCLHDKYTAHKGPAMADPTLHEDEAGDTKE